MTYAGKCECGEEHKIAIFGMGDHTYIPKAITGKCKCGSPVQLVTEEYEGVIFDFKNFGENGKDETDPDLDSSCGP